MEIVDSIKRVARANGVSLDTVAKQIGISRSSLWSRLKDPKFSTIEQIAGIIGVPVAAFFTETGFSAGDAACPHCGAEIKIYLG